MKLLLLGHFCFDVVHAADGSERARYGGIYHAVAALASIVSKADTAIPVFGLGKEDYDDVMKAIGGFANVSPDGIFRLQGPTNRVHYFASPDHPPVECSKDIAPPIPFEKIRRHLGVNGVLINMVSGWDITIETLDAIRMTIRAQGIPLHLDYHNLTLGIGAKHERYRRPVEAWRRWAFMTDTVQLNEEEIAGLTPDRMSEAQTASHLLSVGARAVLVTRGARGVSLFSSSHKSVLRAEIEGISADGTSADTTGCGDIFGAAFHYQYVKSGDLQGSAEYANRIAASHARSHNGGSARVITNRRSP